MQSNVPERLLRIADEIRELGSVRTTRLTIIKRWCQDTRRLRAIAMLIASRVANPKLKGTREAADLNHRARALLGIHPPRRSGIPRRAAQQLHEDLRTFQNEYKKTAWGIGGGSTLTMAGVPQRTIMEILGHRDPRMTLRYQHLAPGHLRDAMRALDRAPIARRVDDRPAAAE